MKLAKVYEPGQYESTTYALWENSDAFKPSSNTSKGTYSIVMPPPNANGNLHIGHALMTVLEDVLIRFNRMKGKSTIWIPGADHAGFETWVVFEKHLEKQGKTRFDYDRNELYAMTWDFVASNRGRMELQLRELGASCDWSHLTFTLDKKVIDTAYSTFEKLWQDELLYRGERIVNFCTFHGTSFSDIEVEYKDEKSKLWEISYNTNDETIVVATTRPETMLGDTAIAIHPDDPRYSHLIGEEAIVPVVNRAIPIIGDKEVDQNFGTGAVKITPAHDPLDFEIGERHKLPRIHVIGFDGRITDEAPKEYRGLTSQEARKKLIEELKNSENLVNEKTFTHSVGHCYKCGTVIEPLCKDQWFLRVQPLAEKAIEAIDRGEIKFYPDSKRKVLINYLKNLKDWNISRQIPWGIPIPAFQDVNEPNDWIFNEEVTKEELSKDGKTYRRDPDTFDTWFSSGQWPYITTDYLDDGVLSKFYPNNVMETGHDILFQWVARMIMLGLYRTGKAPFKDVYLHGLVLDEKGQKMSKSKGNVVNPQELMNKYGSDALRMGLVANRSAGMNQAFSAASVVSGRNFANKIWNIARFIENIVGTEELSYPQAKSIADHWMLSKLQQTSDELASLLDSYRFSEAYELIYHVIWNDLADWYIEASKVEINKPLLVYILQTALKLLHPFAPFVTEAIWQSLKYQEGLLIAQQWPRIKVEFDESEALHFEDVRGLITEIRYLQSELKTKNLELHHSQEWLVQREKSLIDKLARVKVVETDHPTGLHIAHPRLKTWLNVSEKALKAHRDELADRVEQIEKVIINLNARLQNENYVNNAPSEIVDQTKVQLNEQEVLLSRLEEELKIYQ